MGAPDVALREVFGRILILAEFLCADRLALSDFSLSFPSRIRHKCLRVNAYVSKNLIVKLLAMTFLTFGAYGMQIRHSKQQNCYGLA